MQTLKLLSALFFGLLWGNTLFSQTAAGKENVEIIQDQKIKELLEKSIEINSKTTIKGYRVKIHFGNDKTQAYEIKDKFAEKFKDIPAYVKYDQPYFSVRVGNYRTKLEAYKFLKQIQSEYPSAFLVQDDIDYSK